MNEALIERLKKKFHDRFESGGREHLFFSPGRINILGEHVDYNHGKMIPAAIGQGIYFVGSQRDDRLVTLYASDFDETITFDISNPVKKNEVGWANYIIGVIAQFQKREIEVPGFDLVFEGDLPIGAGLSSSAALECGTAAFINHISGSNLERHELIRMAQKAEHEFAGVQCGIMDQFASMMGKEGHAMLLDSHTLSHEYLPIDQELYELVLIDSGVKHTLASSEYNIRRKECEEVLKALQNSNDSVTTFRECTLKMLIDLQDSIEESLFLRGKYVIEEMLRVETCVQSIKANDLQSLGDLMYQTHEGLSSDYQVSCPELDFLVQQTKATDGVLGSRMMGGGFGGCTINLIERTKKDEVIHAISTNYQKEFNIKPRVISVNLSRGTTLLN